MLFNINQEEAINRYSSSRQRIHIINVQCDRSESHIQYNFYQIQTIFSGTKYKKHIKPVESNKGS